MANFFHLKNTPKSTVGVVRNAPADGAAVSPTFSVDEVTNLLQVTPERLQQWGQAFPRFLDEGAKANEPQYSQTDLATLIVIQKLLEAGHDHEQVVERLSPQLPSGATSAQRSAADSASPSAKTDGAHPTEPAPESPSMPEPDAPADTMTSARAPTFTDATDATDAPRTPHKPLELPSAPRQLPASATPGSVNEVVNELLHTVADSQQSMLNIQDSIREMLGVIVQDNFNLKNENRKLRERMLELERALSEYQRREETRKERMEGRLRAVESTLSAIQQQVAQIVQIQRQRNRRGGWFR